MGYFLTKQPNERHCIRGLTEGGGALTRGEDQEYKKVWKITESKLMLNIWPV